MTIARPKTLLGKRVRRIPPAIVPIGAGLSDVREECFCLLIADGVAVALAYRTAGFTSKGKGALVLYGAQRIQDRVTAILRARATSAAVGLPEVTDMLKRVYAGAIHSAEYTPAHNAAFSLARLYGLVVDRAQLDVIRRPSREPDAPSEVSMGAWIDALPAYTAGPAQPQGPNPSGQGPGLLIEGSAHGSDLDGMPISDIPEVPHVNVHRNFSSARQRALEPEGPGEIENGAPSRPVTGTPTAGGHSAPIGSPSSDEGTTYPSAEELF